MVTIREADRAGDIAEVRTLFEEYAASLAVNLGFQNFEQEVAALPGDYTRPNGALLLAEMGGRVVGCIGVRRLDAHTCEMKRLYVRNEAQGNRVGRTLAEKAIEFGKAAGYRAMRLDTLPSMVTAQVLYRQLGFRDVPPYRYNPVPGTTFMELTLGDPVR